MKEEQFWKYINWTKGTCVKCNSSFEPQGKTDLYCPECDRKTTKGIPDDNDGWINPDDKTPPENMKVEIDLDTRSIEHGCYEDGQWLSSIYGKINKWGYTVTQWRYIEQAQGLG